MNGLRTFTIIVSVGTAVLSNNPPLHPVTAAASYRRPYEFRLPAQFRDDPGNIQTDLILRETKRASGTLNLRSEPTNDVLVSDLIETSSVQSVIDVAAITRSLTDRGYQPINMAQTAPYIHYHAHLLPILKDAPTLIHSPYYFPGARLTIRVVNAQEGELPTSRLVLGIQTHLEPEEALARLDRLDDDWWLDTMSSAQGDLFIALDYV